mmetsp:Transcript_25795/g.41889  ORF Transcript_25795/g.41889 Transcript_25795/m.41889 type:complete len:215 (-) Transcript_25795:218-862(-)
MVSGAPLPWSEGPFFLRTDPPRQLLHSLLPGGNNGLVIIDIVTSLTSLHPRLKGSRIIECLLFFFFFVKRRKLSEPEFVDAIAQLAMPYAISHLDGNVVALLRMETLDQVVSALDLARLYDGAKELEGHLVHLVAFLSILLFDLILVGVTLGNEVVAQHFILVQCKCCTDRSFLERSTLHTQSRRQWNPQTQRSCHRPPCRIRMVLPTPQWNAH